MLNGWKAIAAYLNREERTAMRWAKERGLPVHRPPGPGRGSVYAIPAEIDRWLQSARTSIEPFGSDEPVPEPAAATDVVEPGQAPPRDARSFRTRRRKTSAILMVGVALVGGTALSIQHPARVGPETTYRFSDTGAQAAYLQATYDWNLRTRASLARAVREYGAAIERDPRAAPAYVGLANTYLLLREFGVMADDQAYPRAEGAARAAEALAPNSAAAQRALAFVVFWWRHDRRTAREEFARAVSLDPANALTYHWLATALSANGEHDAAAREIVRARELDPADASTVADAGIIDYLAGRHLDGKAMLRALERDQPQAVSPHRFLADIALWERRSREFVQEAGAAARLRGDDRGAAALDRMRGMGDDEVGAALLLEARAEVARTGRGWFQLARVASLAGHRNQALNALIHACRGGEAAVVAAAGDLWLSRTLAPEEIKAQCGHESLLSGLLGTV